MNGNSGPNNPARSLRTFFTKSDEREANENPSSHQCDVIRPNTLPNIGLRLQCDQIGRFLKVMGDKFSYKRNVNMLLILDLLKENITFKYRLLLGNVWICATFNFNIWSHCLQASLQHFLAVVSDSKRSLTNVPLIVGTQAVREWKQGMKYQRKTWSKQYLGR